jgi:hypothetical protein
MEMVNSSDRAHPMYGVPCLSGGRTMYQADERDRVVALDGMPQSSVGAPCPVVFATEGDLIVAFYVQAREPDWDGTSVRVVGLETGGEPAAVVTFKRPYASFFGPPNDEAFGGHPLAARGLEPYGAFEVLESSWLRELERRNSVHPYHRPEQFARRRHFVLTFHDSTFECIAEGWEHEAGEGPLTALMVGRLATAG